ncbi:MAG: hypothetical protein ABII90_15880 [Bacteroidota bacterium]
MNKYFQIQALLLFLILSHGVNGLAQNEVDALRYSQTTFGGTARYMGTAGAFGALGGDISVLNTNPAGIAMYKKSEFTFSPSIYTQNTTSDYYNNRSSDIKYNFNISNIGFVITDLKNSNDFASGWVSSHFAFAYNRLNNFHNRINIQGVNPNSSLLDLYLQNIQGANSSDIFSNDPFGSGLAWDTYLINTDSIDTTTYVSMIPHAGAYQRKIITTRGRMSEMVFSFGSNYNNRLYIGGTLGFPQIRYKEESTYEEIDSEDTIPYFNSFALEEYVSTTGSGINFKFGMIFRATDWFRIGGAVHTPTFFKLSDEYGSEISSNFDSVSIFSYPEEKSYNSISPDGHYDYQLTTPLKLLGNIAFIIGKQGLISADYEFIDYSSSRLRATGNNFPNKNDAIQEKYTSASNIRVGTEWRFPPFSFRGGYAMYGSPFKKGINDGSRTSYTVGFGIRQEGFFIDFAYVFTQKSEDYYLYDHQLIEPANNEMESHNFLATLGFRF